MKSLVQEASTVAKAIEAAWNHAGMPKECSFKILELPKKNFFGITTRPAKIALFFEEPSLQQAKQVSVQPDNRTPRIERSQKPQPSREKVRGIEPQQRTQKQSSPAQEAMQDRPIQREVKPLWNPTMEKAASEWVLEMLTLMGEKELSYLVERDGLTLKITFKGLLVGSSAQSQEEKRLLASFSSLLMTTLKKQFRMALRRHKILFVSTAQN